MPLGNDISAIGFAVDPGGSSFFSRSEISSYGEAWSMLIEPSEGETDGMPVLVQIDTHISGRLSVSGIDALAEAQFSTTSDAGLLLDETLSAVNEQFNFNFQRSQTFESAVGDEFTLQFCHSLQVSGEYGAAASAAYADLNEFWLSVTVTPVPEPSSLLTVVFVVTGLLAQRAVTRR